MNLHFTSGYLPKGDSQTEWTNQTLEQYLCIFCNYQQDNWYMLLLLVEFAYNNALSATTGISPFFANKGYYPNLTIHPERDLSSSHAKDLVVNLDELHQELKTTISKAQHRYQGYANAHQMPALDFTIRQQAFVKAKFFRMTWPSKKLSEKFLGQGWNLFVYTPSSGHHLWCSPIFHVSMLEPTIPNEIPNHVLLQLWYIIQL